MPDYKCHKYHLAKWSERNKSLRCPRCRGKGCYKEYVDNMGNPVDPEGHTVGRCDHGTNCGYHLTPHEWIANGGEVRQFSAINIHLPEPKRIEIPYQIVTQFYQNTLAKSNIFLDWAYNLPLTDAQRKRFWTILELYAIGTTEDGRVIWWQIDENKIVRTGKIMRYNNNGHRCKDNVGISLGIGWVHKKLQNIFGMYPERNGYQLQQCLFGQHLLPVAPNAEIHLVESEKTAFLMALLDTDSMRKRIWMATGGLYNLKPSSLLSLIDRKIVCYPDANGVDKWQESIKGVKAVIAKGWMRQLTEQDGKGADIADVVIRKLIENAPIK